MKNKYIIYIVIILFLATVLLTGCKEKRAQKAESPACLASTLGERKIALSGDEKVLARVNGTPITQYDLDLAIKSTLDSQNTASLDSGARRKVLESLVTGRAIAMAQESELTEKDKAEIDKMVASFREQLLIERYLAGHASIEPVSEKMIREYYESNPERFGRRIVRTYEMVGGTQTLKHKERDDLIAAMKDFSEKMDWEKWVETLQSQGYPVEYHHGDINEKVLHPQLRLALESMKKGETSQLIFIKTRPYLVRITDEMTVPPRPFEEVRAEISKTMIPLALKESIKQAAEEVLNTAEVVYKEN